MLQNSGSVTTRINPPLSPAEREQRYQKEFYLHRERTAFLRCSLKYCHMVIQGKSRSDFPVTAWSAASKSTG
jgi:hypothetical protein